MLSYFTAAVNVQDNVNGYHYLPGCGYVIAQCLFLLQWGFCPFNSKLATVVCVR